MWRGSLSWARQDLAAAAGIYGHTLRTYLATSGPPGGPDIAELTAPDPPGSVSAGASRDPTSQSRCLIALPVPASGSMPLAWANSASVIQRAPSVSAAPWEVLSAVSGLMCRAYRAASRAGPSPKIRGLQMPGFPWAPPPYADQLAGRPGGPPWPAAGAV
jgi:hypothetical protein